MYTIKTSLGKVDISKGRLRNRKQLISVLKRSGIEQVRGMLEVEMEAIAFLMQKAGYPSPNRIRVLDAHGSVRDGDWLYWDFHGRKETPRRVEDWITRNAQYYDALYIHTCNDPKQPYRIGPKACFVVYPLTDQFTLDSIILAVEPQLSTPTNRPLTKIEIVPPLGYVPASPSQKPKHYMRIELLRSLRDRL